MDIGTNETLIDNNKLDLSEFDQINDLVNNNCQNNSNNMEDLINDIEDYDITLLNSINFESLTTPGIPSVGSTDLNFEKQINITEHLSNESVAITITTPSTPTTPTSKFLQKVKDVCII